jgi:hypothetical protein
MRGGKAFSVSGEEMEGHSEVGVSTRTSCQALPPTPPTSPPVGISILCGGSIPQTEEKMATAHTLKRCLLSGRHRTASISASRQMTAMSCARTRAASLQMFNSSMMSFDQIRDFNVSNGFQVRHLSTTDDNDDHEWRTPDNYAEAHRYTPQNEHQRKLVDYTNSLLSTEDKDYPIGAYPYTDLIQMSNCIDSWIASGEHRYLGAHQAELLVKRLIIERGGGRSLVGENAEEFVGGNIDVTWDMYHLESVGASTGSSFLDFNAIT